MAAGAAVAVVAAAAGGIVWHRSQEAPPWWGEDPAAAERFTEEPDAYLGAAPPEAAVPPPGSAAEAPAGAPVVDGSVAAATDYARSVVAGFAEGTAAELDARVTGTGDETVVVAVVTGPQNDVTVVGDRMVDAAGREWVVRPPPGNLSVQDVADIEVLDEEVGGVPLTLATFRGNHRTVGTEVAVARPRPDLTVAAVSFTGAGDPATIVRDMVAAGEVDTDAGDAMGGGR